MSVFDPLDGLEPGCVSNLELPAELAWRGLLNIEKSVNAMHRLTSSKLVQQMGPAQQTWACLVVALVVGFYQLPGFVGAMWPPREIISDFFQDWASARNLLRGLPIYSEHRDTVPMYVGDVHPLCFCNRVNAHPPTSVLLLVPLAFLDYRPALLIWDLVSLTLLIMSLGLVIRGLGMRFGNRESLALFSAFMFCSPLRQQLFQGQLNLVLLALLTGAWAADRTGRPGWAGALVGAGAAIKLYPGFLLIYFVLGRRWRSAIMGVLTVAVVSIMTAIILGPEAYRAYFFDVMPRIRTFSSSWFNASLVAYWNRLFDPDTHVQQVEPLWRNAAVARAGILLTWIAVLAVIGRNIRVARTRTERDHAFGAAISAMLLLSPVTWDHGYLLLLVPVGVLWADPPRKEPSKILLMTALVGLWFWHRPACDILVPGGILQGMAYPVHSITVLSYPCYAIVVILILGTARVLGDRRSPREDSLARGQSRDGSASLAVPCLSS